MTRVIKNLLYHVVNKSVPKFLQHAQIVNDNINNNKNKYCKKYKQLANENSLLKQKVNVKYTCDTTVKGFFKTNINNTDMINDYSYILSKK